jgi:hypothetical protein
VQLEVLFLLRLKVSNFWDNSVLLKHPPTIQFCNCGYDYNYMYHIVAVLGLG